MKTICWVGTAFKDLCAFPTDVRKIAGRELRRVQSGDFPIDWKPMSSIGSGVNELRIHAAGEHRVIYVAKFCDWIYVLHAFEKKTQKTPRKDCDFAMRYKAILRDAVQAHRES